MNKKSTTLLWIDKAMEFLNKASEEIENWPKLHQEYMKIENTIENLDKLQTHIYSLDFDQLTPWKKSSQTTLKAGDKVMLKNLSGRKYNPLVALNEGDIATVIEPPTTDFPDAAQIEITNGTRTVGYGAIDLKCLEPIKKT